MNPQPFDDARRLQAQAEGSLAGQTSAAYWNMVGPYGGITAAITLQAVMQHPDRLGEPTALTVYCHADHQQLAESGSGYLLGQARGQGFRNGFFDHSGLLWEQQGALLASTHQIVYYKA